MPGRSVIKRQTMFLYGRIMYETVRRNANSWNYLVIETRRKTLLLLQHFESYGVTSTQREALGFFCLTVQLVNSHWIDVCVCVRRCLHDSK